MSAQLAARVAGRVRQVRNVVHGRWLRRRLAGPRLLRAFADGHPRARFVEIGANDGERWDHIRPFVGPGAWRGVLVEPVPHLFERLRKTYRDVSEVRLENVAVAATSGGTRARSSWTKLFPTILSVSAMG